MLRRFGFDLNFIEPIPIIDRYLRLLDEDTNYSVKEMTILICILF